MERLTPPTAGWGAADTLFPRLTTADFSYANYTGGGFTLNRQGNAVWDETLSADYSVRGGTPIWDASPRIISNLIANQDGLTPLQVQDDPSLTPGGRLSPLTGNDNPLAYSSYMTIFGQFFDHGLDFVHKGDDGAVIVPLLPGDDLYREGSQTNFMVASRTNTVNVNIGEGSTDSLVDLLGLTEGKGNWTAVTGTQSLGGTYSGTLVLNNHIITLNAVDPNGLIDALNAQTPTTGVTASITGGFLTLTPATGEAFNTVSPFIDLSQSYGSASSHTVFVREYDANGKVTGRLVSGTEDKNSDGTKDGMATWADIKSNALKIGIVLHDYNVQDIPLVRMNADGSTYFDASGKAWLVALDKVTGAYVYVQDTDKVALATISDLHPEGLVLMTTGHASLDDMAHGVLGSLNANGDLSDPTARALLDAHFIAGDGRVNENIGLTAIHDVFHSEHNRVLEQIKSFLVLGNDGVYRDVNGNAWSGEDLFQAAKLVTEMEYQHLVFGEFARKLSPNINAFAGYEAAVNPAITAEFAHAVYRFGHSMLTEVVGLQAYDANGVAVANQVKDITGAALSATQDSANVRVTIAGHGLVTGNYVTLGNVTDEFAGFSAADFNGAFKVKVIDADTVVITMQKVATATETGSGSDGVKATLDQDIGLIEAFLNPRAYDGSTAGEIAIGMGSQVGNGIDEWMTDALRDNLVGLPLDLAALNIVRARDSGVGTLNEVRADLYASTGLIQLKPYESWEDFGMHLLHPESLKNFIMAYARDAILTQFGMPSTDWNALQLSDPAAYAAALSAAAVAAMDDAVFMNGDGNLANANQDFNRVDLWIGGLAEQKVTGGMLGSTFDFVFATQMIALQNNDRFYYLDRLVGTNMLAEIEGQLFSDIVMRNTGVTHLYSDIFSVADKYVEISANTVVKQTFSALQAATTTVVDASGITRSVGQAGVVGDTFYGNSGHYLDARGVYDPNGAGNASEMIGGTGANNKINALGGNDAVYGDGGNDTIEGGNGNDFLHGGDDNDSVSDTQGDDFLWGDAGNDTLNGGAGIDQMFGGDGNDLVYGGTGGDVMEGGVGNDTLYGDNTATDLTGDADVMSGGDGNDILYGGGGADALDGREGNDTLVGGAGNDAMTGWSGNDRFVMDAADFGFNNALDGGIGFDIVDYSASSGNGIGTGANRQGVNINLSNAGPAVLPVGVNIPDSFLAIEGVIGSAYNDTLVGGAAVQTDAAGLPIFLTDANGNPIQQIDPVTLLPVVDALGNPVFVTIPMNFYLEGRAGQDFLQGGAGNDTLAGGAGNDTMDGGLGSDTVSYFDAAGGVNVNLNNQGTTTLNAPAQNNGAAAGSDRLVGFENITGGNFNDTLTGDGVNNVLTGGGGSDNLVGNAGNDTLDGGTGNDTLDGGAGIDTVSYAGAAAAVTVSLVNQGTTAGNAPNVITGGAGTDRLIGFENLTGSVFGDGLTGDGTNNIINGGAGDDIITGGGGADTLIGGAGNDTLQGDAGADVAIFTGNVADYRVTYDAATQTYTVTDLRVGSPDGVDRTFGVETFTFADRSVAATAFIPPIVSFGTPSVSVNEGNAGATTMSFTVNLSSAFATPLTVDWAVAASGGAPASPSDMFGGSFPSGTLTFAPGTTTATISVQIQGDTVQEETESFAVTLSNPTGGLVLGLASTATGIIVNDDLPVLNLSIANGSQIEGSGGSTVYTFTLTLDQAVLATETVSYAVTGTGANAANAADFVGGVLPSGNVTFNAGDQTATIQIAVDSDLALEADETFTLTLSNGSAGIRLGAATATATILNDDQDLYGTAGADTLTGNANANRLYGLAGNDSLTGGLGNDSLYGGLGDDTIVVDDAGDFVFEALNEGNDTVRTALASYTLVANVENLVQTNGVAFTGTGNELANVITGGTGADNLSGLAGNDTLNGAAGADTLAGGDGNDSLVGGAGSDQMAGGLGNDTYDVDVAGDVIVESVGEGVDTIRTGLATFTLGAGIEVESIVYTGAAAFTGTGNEFANTITGGGGADVLIGGAGNDTLTGGVGADTLTGGAGADRFVFASLDGGDRVTDFVQGTDIIGLSEAIFGNLSNNAAIANNAFVSGANVTALSAASANTRVIYNTTSGELWVDADGTGAGTAVSVGTIWSGATTHPALTAASFVIIA